MKPHPQDERYQVINQVIRHNGRAVYCMFMRQGVPAGFRVDGVGAPLQNKPEMVAFTNPALINSTCANDPKH